MIGALLARNPLATALGVLLAIALIAGGVQTLRLAWAQDEVHAAELTHQKFKTDLAEASLKAEREAKAKSDQGIKELTDEVRSVGLVATAAKTEIRVVASNGGPCGTDPAYLAMVRGVQSILDTRTGAGGDPGKAGPGAPAKVRGAAAAGSGQRP